MLLRAIPSRQLSKSAFTLIELLVVISIIAVIMGILLPALNSARETGQEAKCRANLKNFGMGIMTYANSNDDFTCSGAFDPEVGNKRDGPVDQVGWVADQVNAQSAFPGVMLCPSNPARYNQKLGIDGHTYAPSQASDLIRRGYNTNYTQSWYMGRTQYNPEGTGNLKSITGTFWALSLSSLRNVDTSRVPLLGDGRTDPDNLVLKERAIKTMTDGPYSGNYGIQNYADFGPAHGRAAWIGSKNHNRVRANILFADGHVGFFKDIDRDGEFGLDDQEFPNVRQKDLDGSVFDGVLSIGRRSKSADAMD
jgi:prepilin-type N-terminal cleavage/methylation domain-containing protein/prepilin-type processing-associated H-X9-DG protein